MKKILLFVCLVILLSGCATTEYYTNPQSAGYTQQVFGALCENCNREFTFSAENWNTWISIKCPFCGHDQDLKMARNRWLYAANQQQAANTQAALMGFAQGVQQINQQRAAAENQAIQNFQNNINRQGTYTNPIYIKERQ